MTTIVRKVRRATAACLVAGTVLMVAMAPMLLAMLPQDVAVPVLAAILLIAGAASPWWSAAVAGWSLRKEIAAASVEPIQKLYDELAGHRAQHDQFRGQISRFEAKVTALRAQLSDYEAQFPSETSAYKSMLGKMSRLLSLRKAQFQRTAFTLQLLQYEIARAESMYDVTLIGSEFKRMKAISENTMIDKLLTRVRSGLLLLDKMMIAHVNEHVAIDARINGRIDSVHA